MKSILQLLAITLLSASGLAQTDGIVSPEVLSDKRVVFRVAAPEAKAVGVFIDSMKGESQEPMKRDGAGIWTVRAGPLQPGIYIYHFIIDGLKIADPVNPKLKLRARTSASLLEVPGASPEIWEARDVPHGSMEINYHKASTLEGETREVWVYTPPGYQQNTSRRYPVLYLLHGSNDTPAGWSTVGRANFTMDNLLAEGRARAMIIVTPFGHAVPFGSNRDANTPSFEQYLLKDVMPMIETKYRVAKGRENRAIAGFSMGGGQALYIGLGHLDLFSSVAALSPGVPRDFESRYATLLEDRDGTNARLKLFWIGCGKDDSLFEASQKLDTLLTKHGIEHIYRATPGAHTYNVWRGYFSEIAPLLFVTR